MARQRIVQLDYEPNEKQSLAHAASEMFILYGGAVGGGKTVYLINELQQLCLEFPGNRVYLCQHELATFMANVYPKLISFLAHSAVVHHDRSRRVIRYQNGSELCYGGLRPSGNDRELSRVKGSDWGAFGVDEASETQEMFINMLIRSLRLRLPSGKRPRYRGLFTSNPEDCWVKSWFIDESYRDESWPDGLFKIKGKPNRVFVQARIHDNEQNLPGAYVSRMMESFRDTPGWKSRYIDGNWESIGEEQFNVFPYATVRAAQARTAATVDEPIDVGIDVARLGSDDSVIAARQGDRIWVENRIQGRHRLFPDVWDAVRTFRDGNQVKTFYIDSVGVGGGLADKMIEDGFPVTEWVAGSTEGVDKERYSNLRTQASWELRKILQADGCKIQLPSGEEAKEAQNGELCGQFTSIRYERMSDKKIKLESKLTMKRRDARSPDLAEAIIMACSGLTLQPDKPLGPPVIRWL